MAPTLAAYVGETVTIRYDPRDITEVRVFHRGSFVCRAICPEHAGETITLKDIQTARIKHRKALQTELRQLKRRISDFLPDTTTASKVRAKSTPIPSRRRQKLHVYFEDRGDG